ncbi:MAG: hypothetical protein WA350_16255, partial [Candidatus Sulfotelmatobacter sp.]
ARETRQRQGQSGNPWPRGESCYHARFLKSPGYHQNCYLGKSESLEADLVEAGFSEVKAK